MVYFESFAKHVWIEETLASVILIYELPEVLRLGHEKYLLSEQT